MTGAGSTTRIGPYQILREIGRGGMGVVFAARDTRLDREVAVKALPELLASHPERLARFQREARLLASLNHPHIASIYGLEEIDGRSYLVLEYVEGETLEAMLKRRGALPVEDALAIALQIARAVEAAHERGVIHRDLKPANIKFTAAGDVKVLDFGLAKAMEGAGGSLAGSAVTADGELTQPPPSGLSVATIPGLVLGSPGYLSPEQARGQPADRRTDVFSFGCLLYEMLTGVSLFAGQSIGDSIGATLYKDPDWSALPANTPPTIRLLLRRCLKKDPRQRLHDIADARLELEEAIADPTGSLLTLAAGTYVPPRRWRQRLMPAIVGLVMLCLGGAGGWLSAAWYRGATPPVRADAPVVRFSLALPDGTLPANVDNTELAPLAISPDGRRIAFSVYVEGETRIWIREIDSGVQREITAARGANGPFFSPDGRWLGFHDGSRLLKASLEGGPAAPICEVPQPNGRIAWLSNGRIVFTGSVGQGLFSVAAEGGQPTEIAKTDRGAASAAQRPIIGFGGAVPMLDGRSVLCPIWHGNTIDDYELVAVNSETGELKRVLPQAAMPAMLESGILVFLRNDTLLAVKFDSERMTPVGQPVPVLEGVLAEGWAADAQFALSPSGTLAYTPGGRTSEDRKLILLDRDGTPTHLVGPDAFTGQLSVSPQGRYVTVTTLRRKLELWVYDLQRRTMSLVHGDGEPYEPVWSPDGTELAFMLEGMAPALVRKQVFSSSPPQVLMEEANHYPSSWTEGTLLLSFQNPQGANRTDIVAVDTDATGAAAPRPVIATTANEFSARISPDGQWMLYGSDVSGKAQVYLSAWPFDGRSWQVSTEGGFRPMWDDAGQAYFVKDDEQLFACRLTLTPGQEPEIDQPQLLFDLKPTVATSGWGFIAPVADGQFVAVGAAPWESETDGIEVVVNWGEQVAAKLKADRAP